MAREFKVGEVGGTRTIIKSPDIGWSWSRGDISTPTSGRSLTAKMDKNLVATKDNLQLNWSCCSDCDTKNILQKIKARTYIDLEYPCPYTGDNKVITVYTGDPQASLIAVQNNICYWNIQISLIEQ